MPKRPPPSATEPIDIFSSPRFEDAMVRSTAVSPGIPEVGPASSPETIPPDPPKTSKRARSEFRQASTSPRPRVRPRTEEVPPPDAAAPPPLELNVALKFRVPYALRADFQAFKTELSAKLGVLLDDSNIGRPYLELLLSDFRERILEIAESHRSKLRRPAHTDAVAMAEFDDSLGNIIREGVRRRPTRSPSSEPEA
jgi:hypothetical protein